MGMMEKLKSMLLGVDLPAETRSVFEQAKNLKDLREGRRKWPARTRWTSTRSRIA